MQIIKGVTQVLLSTSAALAAFAALAQPDWDNIEIVTTPVTDGIFMLSSAAGGNIGLSVGDDGVLLIDDQFAQISSKINDAIDSVSTEDIRFVLNTHWHFDHVGDNANMASQGAVIVAHNAVRSRMQVGQTVPAFAMDIPPAPTQALPVVTFADSMALHFNGHTMELTHTDAAHTDGDSFVFFLEANVLHTGDLFWKGMYPLVDGSSGGSAQGMVDAVARVITLTDEDTLVIPGHGPLGNKSDLEAYHDMLQTVVSRISRQKNQGMSLEQVVAAKPTAEYDSKWGQGLFTGDAWVGVIYGTVE